MSLASSESSLYMGIDIESGKPGSPNAKYSVIIVNSEGKLITKSYSASLSRIIRLTWEFKPRAIGVDNVFELASDIPKLHKLLNLLPPETKIIQVNIINNQIVTLRDVAKKAHVDLGPSKLNSMRTAYVIALLVSKGYGTAVFMEEEKTIITVSKGRGSRKGGMSQARYQRRVRASVLHATKKIQEILDKAGIDYDVHFKGGKGGLDRAVFTVYAPRRKLYGLIRPHKGINYIIKFRTIYGKKLSLGTPEMKIERPIVVGIDPGIMVGLAILDLDGNILHLESNKNLDRGSLVETISKYGKPVIIAVDTAEIPEIVKAVAAKYQALVYSPTRSMLISEKIFLAKQALNGENPETQHERDALAAAYKALSIVQSKLNQIDSYLSKIDVDIDYDKIKEAVLKGSTLAEAVETEIQRILSEEIQEHNKIDERNIHCIENPRDNIKSLLGRIDELRARIQFLEEKNKELLNVLENYKKELKTCKNKYRKEAFSIVSGELESLKVSLKLTQQELEKKEKNLEDIKKENEKIYTTLMKVARGKIVLARKISTLTINSIKKSEKELGFLEPGEVLYVTNPGTYELKAIEYVAKANISAILLNGSASNLANSLRKFGIPVFKTNEYELEIAKESIFVDSKIIDDAIKARKNLKEQKTPIDLTKIVSEYRKYRTKKHYSGEMKTRKA